MIEKSTYEYLKPIVESINKTFKVKTITDNEDGTYTLHSCNTLWATQGFSVTIDDISYKVTSIDPNESITIEDPDKDNPTVPDVTEFELYPPVFYHGTIRSTEIELNQHKNDGLLSTDKLPMIWLHEPVDEQIDDDEMNAIERISDCELYFMVDADFANWTNENHYKYAIKPMRNLIVSFKEALRRSGTVNDNLSETLEIKDFARWGVTMTKEGIESMVFSNYEMSGTKLMESIHFIRTEKNCCS